MALLAREHEADLVDCVALVVEHGVGEVGLAVAQGVEEIVSGDVCIARRGRRREPEERERSGKAVAVVFLDGVDEVAVVAAVVTFVGDREGVGAAASVLHELPAAEDLFEAGVALARGGVQKAAVARGVVEPIKERFTEALLLGGSRGAVKNLPMRKAASRGMTLVTLELGNHVAAARAVGRATPCDGDVLAPCTKLGRTLQDGHGAGHGHNDRDSNDGTHVDANNKVQKL